MTDIHFQLLFESLPTPFLILRPNLSIVCANQAYLNATMTRSEDLVGKYIFEAFPDNPNDPEANGVRNLNASLERVLMFLKPDTMAVQKYDIRQPTEEGGGFEERFWSPMNSPVFGEDGTLTYVIHRVEDVTDLVRLQQAGVEKDRLARDLRLKYEQLETDVRLRGRELDESQRTLQVKDQALARVAQRLHAPLAPVLLAATALRDDPRTPAELGRQLEQLCQNIQTEARLIRELLGPDDGGRQATVPA